MIVTRLKEGLGNQMFQYAAGISLSLQKGTAFFFDDSIYTSENWYSRKKIGREFGLGAFCLTGKPLDGWRRFCVLTLIRRRYFVLRVLLHALGVPIALKYICDTGVERKVDERLQKCGNNIFLDGYWQTENYFKSVRKVILSEFTFRESPDAKNAALLSGIISCDAVCVHVRRVDYTTPESLAIRGICRIDYYREAVDYITRRVRNPHFYIFSDDPAWVGLTFQGIDSVTMVTHNVGHRDAEDLRLMVHCKHFIIANSSFSWWAAWLGQYSEKIVVAPRRWMANGDDYDVVPDGWVRL